MQTLPPYINRSIDRMLYSGLYWDQQEIDSILHSVKYGKWFASGEEVMKFERAFSKKFNFNSSLMLNSGSSANLCMITALKKYYGWTDNSEIIVSAVGFPTTTSAILFNNLVPKFVDIDMSDLNWNMNKISEKISDKTVAVFASPVLGNPFDMDLLTNICDYNNIKIIVDNCDSLGSKWNNKLLTDYSIISSCSFYASHHISTGEGGMISSQNDALISLSRSIAWWGRDCYCVGQCNLLPNGTCKSRFSRWLPNHDGDIDHKYIYTNIGLNLKPLDLQGAIGLVQLSKFDEIDSKRKIHKNIIENLLYKYVDGIRVIDEKEQANTSWFGVPIVCDSKKIKQKLVCYLEDNHIQTRNYFAGNLLLHPGYQHLDDYKLYPEANKILDLVFFIGCAPYYTDETFTYLEDVLQKWKNTKLV